MMPTHIKPLLQKMALFSQLPEEELERLSHLVRVRNYSRDENIIQLGEHLECFYIVVSGAVTISVISPKGDSRIIEIVHSGQSFGEALLFLDKVSPVQARATKTSRLIMVPGKEVLTLSSRSTAFSHAMLAGLSMRLHKLVTDIQACSLNRSHQRVIGYLLAELEDQIDQEGSMTIELPVSKKLVASRLDLTAETFSRVLHELSEQGVIRVNGKTIEIINVDNLRQSMSIHV